MPETPCRRCDGERGDVPVPGEVVGLEFCRFDWFVRFDGGGVGRGFEFAEDWER